MNGATVLTKFTADTKDLDGKTQQVKGALNGLTTAFGIGAGAASVMGKAYAVAGKAVIQMTKSSVESAAELEQQIGGTEAVFGQFADEVQKKASESFSSMGTDASEYMQTINKMASILQGSGYTVEDSMDTSSEVMQRAADVASVMGISVEEAMNAVTAAAKGNFTMMDNLGVAMNATNLQAYALEQGITKSYNSMTTAEKSGLAYQMFLDKTSKYAGNYAKENKTVAGSMNTLSKSWKNFLSGAGKTEDVVDSVINVLDALVPKIVELAPKIVTGVIQIVNALIPQLPGLINQLLPAVIQGATLLIQGLIAAIPELINVLLTSLPTIIQMLLDGTLLIITSLAQMLPDMLPQIIDAILGIIPLLIDNLPLFIEAGYQLLIGLVQGIIQSIPVLVQRVWEIIKSIVGYWKQVPSMMLNIGKNIIQGLWNGMKSLKDWAVNKVKNIGKSILGGLKGILGIASPSKEFAMIGKFSVLGYTEALDDMKKDIQTQVGETFGISPQLANSSALHYSPNVVVNNTVNMKQDPLGQMVNDIKTFSGGSKNDYNYGMGV